MLANAPVIVTMPAVDLERAGKFYTEKLGLKPLEAPGGAPAVFFEAGAGTRLFLYQREKTKAEHTAATFEVADIIETVKGLQERGVEFEQYDMGEIKTDAMGIATMGENKAAWFKDTEGNIISIVSQ